MSCGCKNNTPQPQKQPQVIKVEGGVEIRDVSNPNYTREDVIRIKDYVSSINKTETERRFVYETLLNAFGDLIPDYCDQACLNHVSNRVTYMEGKLTEYEIFIMNK